MKVINIVLFALVLLGMIACIFFGYQFITFPTADYAYQAESLRAEAAQVEADTARLEEELQAREEALKADIAQAGEAGAAVAERLAGLETQREEKAAELARLEERVSFAENAYENMLALRDEYAGKIRQLEEMIVNGETDVKICYWTLDDGPTYYTSDFLDIAKEYGAYLTFFTSKEANDSAANDDPEVERALLRREIMEGHAIGNHTVSHQYAQYGNVYGMGIDSFFEQVDKQTDWVFECTDVKPDIFRFPGGSAWAFNRIPKDEVESGLAERGYVWVDWSCDVADNLHANPDVQTVYSRAIYQVRTMKIAILLCHDWNLNTYYALKQAIPVLQEDGYIFLPLFSQSWTIENTSILFD